MSVPDNIFLALFAAAMVLEFDGIASRRKNDTISEMGWWLRDHIRPLFYGLMILLVWLPFHIAFGGH